MITLLYLVSIIFYCFCHGWCKNMVLKQAFICFLNILFIFKFGFIIYIIKNSLIRWFVSSSQIYLLAICDKGRRWLVPKEKWNQLNLIDIQSLLETNHRLPLSHMAKSYIWLEEKNQRINDFSIGYMMNPNFKMNKVFREQMKVFLKTTFFTSTMTQISVILLKPNTRVLALVMFYENI